MSEERVRSVVVGVGHLGSLHARYLATLGSAELIGVYDAAPERAALIARETRSVAFPSLDALLDAQPEFAVVSTPTESHFATARALLERGVATLVEKPITRTLAEADALLDCARHAGGKAFLGVGHVERFNPVVQAARRHMHDPLFIECDRVHPFTFRSTDIGVVLDLMIHDIDLVLWLAGSVLESLEGVGASVLSESEDLAFARLRFENGCVAIVRASRVSLRKERRLRVFCSDLYVSLDHLARRGTTIRVRPGAKEEIRARLRQGTLDPASFLPFLEVENLEIEEEQPLRAELAAFVEARRRGDPPPVSGEAGREALACALRIQEDIGKNLASIREKRRTLTRPEAT